MKDAPMDLLNKSCRNKDFNNLLALCREYHMPYMGMFTSTAIRRLSTASDDGIVKYHNYFSSIINASHPKYRVKLLCNWTDRLKDLWSHMHSKESAIELVDESPDYWVIINRPPRDAFFIPSKTMVFQMEPSPDLFIKSLNRENFLKVFTHDTSFNNIEWHISMSVDDADRVIEKRNGNVISAILSDKYYDEGHIKRVDFVKHIESVVNVDVYGDNLFTYKSYCGSLPPMKKDDGLFPYKYHFNAENNAIPNYFTEKIIDAILTECLCFYWGCPNISEHIDPNAFIVLPLNDFEKSLGIIVEAIQTDEWSKRIDTIRLEKKRIMKDLNFFTRVESIISSNKIPSVE